MQTRTRADGLSVTLIDEVLLEELRLLIDVTIAGDRATTRLSQSEVDRALGI